MDLETVGRILDKSSPDILRQLGMYIVKTLILFFFA